MFVSILCFGLLAAQVSVPAPVLTQEDYVLAKAIAKDIRSKYSVSFTDAYVTAESAIRNSRRYGVPIELILAVATAESAYNKDAVSHAGAEGIMQIMPRTAEQIAKTLHVKEYNMFDIRNNIRFGTWYLKHLKEKFGSYELAVRAYNCGPNRTQQVIDGKRGYPKETQAYYVSVVTTYIVVKMAMPYIREGVVPQQVEAFSFENNSESAPNLIVTY
jgi:soluble lytic murein transglycosylase-like protein